MKPRFPKPPTEVWCVWDDDSGPAWFTNEKRAREIAKSMTAAGWKQTLLRFVLAPCKACGGSGRGHKGKGVHRCRVCKGVGVFTR